MLYFVFFTKGIVVVVEVLLVVSVVGEKLLVDVMDVEIEVATSTEISVDSFTIVTVDDSSTFVAEVDSS
jgi:hypothetical protein